MKPCQRHIGWVAGVAVWAVCVGLAGVSVAAEPGTKKACKAEAKAAGKACDATKKASLKSCKALVKTHKAMCAKKKKECAAKIKEIKRGQGGTAAQLQIKCGVQHKICKSQTTGDIKRCEYEAKTQFVQCDMKVEDQKNLCVAFIDVDTTNFRSQCRAQCGAEFRTSVPTCKAKKKLERDGCTLEQKLHAKDCKALKGICSEENRVLRLLQKTGGEIPEFAAKQDCRNRREQCVENSEEDLRLCRRRLKKVECDPINIRACTRQCVQVKKARANADLNAAEEAALRDAEQKAREESEALRVKALEEKLAQLPSAESCSRHATKVYGELLDAVITAIKPHKDNANKAFRVFEKTLKQNKRDNRCVLDSMQLWARLPSTLNKLIQNSLPNPEAEFAKRLGPSGVALAKDVVFSSLFTYTFTKYHK